MRPFPRVSTEYYLNDGVISHERASAHRRAFDEFAKLLNLDRASDFQLLMTWCVFALTPDGPYPILAVSGEQGSAKSTLVRLIHELVDPSHAPLRSLPSSDKDIFVAASNAHVLAFDNISRISPSTSDNLCRISTGGAYVSRKSGTDRDEVLLNFRCPIILNGIGDLIVHHDLADRAVFLKLTGITDRARRETASINDAFQKLRPQLTEALLDLLVLARYNFTLLEPFDKLPRMAEFAKIGIAIECMFGEPGSAPGSFMSAYARNRAELTDDLIENDPILLSVLELFDEQHPWSGTMQDLQSFIAKRFKRAGTGTTPLLGLAQLSSHLKRIKPALDRNNINIAFERAKTRDRRRTVHFF